MDCRQLKEIIIVPTLTALAMYSPSAVNLLLGTCAQESQLGHYLVQQGIAFKGGIGIFQMQVPTYNNIWDKQIAINAPIRARIKLLLGYENRPPAERMATDLVLATIMARLLYYGISLPLPAADDIKGLAAFYKRWFNTYSGKATEQEFIENYQKYVL